MPNPSLDPAKVPPDLPSDLATLYRELGGLIELDGAENPFGRQDCLVPLSRLKRVDGLIEFAWENQGNWSARCRPGEGDPPVLSNAAELWELPQPGFVEVCPSLQHFLTTLCLQEAVMGCRSLAVVDVDRPVDELLETAVEPLWTRGQYVGEEPSHPVVVSQDRDILVMQLFDDFWIGSSQRNVETAIAHGVRRRVIRPRG